MRQTIYSTLLDSKFNENVLNKKFKALVTAGPTREYVDPVRFITNKSSGKQGFELAKSLAKKGFETTLISGPTNLKVNENINLNLDMILQNNLTQNHLIKSEILEKKFENTDSIFC